MWSKMDLIEKQSQFWVLISDPVGEQLMPRTPVDPGRHANACRRRLVLDRAGRRRSGLTGARPVADLQRLSSVRPAPALPSVAEGRLRSLPDRAPSVLARPKLRGCAMAALLSGYARCSTDQQSLPAQRACVTAPGVASLRINDDHGLTGTNRGRHGLREALAAGREGDALVVTKLDRLARSQPDARAITDELAAGRSASAWVVQSTTPTDVVARLLFNVLTMIAQFESELIRLRTREGMKITKAAGRLRGRKPNRDSRLEAHLVWSSLGSDGRRSSIDNRSRGVKVRIPGSEPGLTGDTLGT